MSFGDLFPEEREAATVAQALRPIQPREDSGFDLGREAAYVRDEIGSTLTYAARGATLSLAAPFVAAEKLTGSGGAAAGQIFEFTRQVIDPAVEFWKPDPQGVSMAGQIVGGLGRFGTEFFMGGGPMGVVVNEQMRISQEVADAGGDPLTVGLTGAARGLTTGLGLKLAAAYGTSIPARVASGAALNTGAGIADRAAVSAILEADDLDGVAAKYQPFDPVQLAVDAVFGGVIGGFTRADVQARPEADAEMRAAAQTVNLRDEVQRGLLLPKDGPEADIAHNMLDGVLERVRGGQAAEVDPRMPLDPEAVQAATARVEEGLRVEARARAAETPEPVATPAMPRAHVQALTSAVDALERMVPGNKTGAIDTRVDDLRTVIEKLGGWTRTDAVAEGIDPAEAAKMYRMFPKEGRYRTADGLLEGLKENGFLPQDATKNDALDLVDRAVRGEEIRSTRADFDALGPDWLRGLPDGLAPDVLQQAVRKALAGEKLGPKQQRAVQSILDAHDAEMAAYSREVDAADPQDAWDALPREAQDVALRMTDEEWQALLDQENRDGISNALPEAQGSGGAARTASGGDRPANASSQADAGNRTDAADPVAVRAEALAAERPDLTIPIVDEAGNEVRMSLADALAMTQREIDDAATDSRAFEAAAACFLRG